MFSKVGLCKTDQFLDKSRAAREERANERHRECSAIAIQAMIWAKYLWPLSSCPEKQHLRRDLTKYLKEEIKKNSQ